MNNEKVVINREKKGRKKKSIEGYIAKELYNKLDNQVYKEIHIFRPPSRQGAQVVGFQGERELSAPCSHITPSPWCCGVPPRAGHPKSPPELAGGRAGRGKEKLGWDRRRWRQIPRLEGNLPHVQAFSGDHPFFSSSISLLSCCWLRLQTV